MTDDGTRTTWTDVERRALTCPILHRMLTGLAHGYYGSREAALIATLLWLSDEREQRNVMEIERANRAAPAPIELHVTDEQAADLLARGLQADWGDIVPLTEEQAADLNRSRIVRVWPK